MILCSVLMNKTKTFTMIAAIVALAAFAAAALTTVQQASAEENSSCSRTGEVFCVLSGNTNSNNDNEDSFNFEID